MKFISLLTDFQQEFRKNPSSLLDYLGTGLRNTKSDLPYSELLQLGFLATQISLKHVTNFVVPGTTGMVGTESVVHISPSANSLYADLKADGCIAGGRG